MLDFLKRLFWPDRTFGAIRSNQWPRVRKDFLSAHPTCAICGGHKKIEVHHRQPFHLRPELELEWDNLITLCESKKWGVACHQWFGHLGDYRLCNPNVEKDAKIWAEKFANRKVGIINNEKYT